CIAQPSAPSSHPPSFSHYRIDCRTRCRLCCTDSHSDARGLWGVIFSASTGKYIKEEIKYSGYVGMITDMMNRIDRIQIARPILFIL
ncbi:MAG: hypothetical protein KAH86_07580, partial [Methanosarcinales archaeon]|nr:hypothetical protein [Methanosarcinales archaeon]